MKPLSRRTFLRGASGVALALPFLDAMRPSRARAQTPPSPRRIMFVFQANGDETAKRFSAAGETSFQLGEFLSPLEPYRATDTREPTPSYFMVAVEPDG